MFFIIILIFHILTIAIITFIISIQRMEFNNIYSFNYIDFKDNVFFKNISYISILTFFLIIIFIFNSFFLAKLSIIKNYNKINAIINNID